MNSTEKQPSDIAAAILRVAEQRNGEGYNKGFKCAVRGCNSHFGEGHFVGALCSQCDAMLRSGVVPPGGATFIHDLYYNVQQLEARARLANANALLQTVCDKSTIGLDHRTREVVREALLAAMKEGEEHERSKGQS